MTSIATATAPRFRPEPLEDPARGDRAQRPRIEAVPAGSAASARPRLVYGIVAGVGLGVIVAAQLLLSVGLSQGAYEISALQQTEKTLGRSNSDAKHVIDQLSSAQNLASNALGLGMVANSSPVYLRLSDGAVLGVPTAAGAESAGATVQNLVPNSLLATTKAEAAGAAAAATASAGAGATGAAAPLQGELPAPVTH